MTERSVFAFPDDTKAAAAKEKCYAMAVLRASVFHVRIIRDFSLAKACMSTATSSSSTISTPVMVSITSSIDTTPRRQPYSSRMIEICSCFSSIFSHI